VEAHVPVTVKRQQYIKVPVQAIGFGFVAVASIVMVVSVLVGLHPPL